MDVFRSGTACNTKGGELKHVWDFVHPIYCQSNKKGQTTSCMQHEACTSTDIETEGVLELLASSTIVVCTLPTSAACPHGYPKLVIVIGGTTALIIYN
jgi:hypothetical protein